MEQTSRTCSGAPPTMSTRFYVGRSRPTYRSSSRLSSISPSISRPESARCRPFPDTAAARRRADPVTRREVITLLGSATVSWPGVTRAQRQPMPVIGYLRSGSRAASSQVEAAFRQGLSSMGFIEGRNVAIDYQYAENQNDRLMALTADLLRQPLALI